MIIEFTQKELEALKDLITMELKETKELFNSTTIKADRTSLSNWYDTLYMIKQKLNKEQLNNVSQWNVF